MKRVNTAKALLIFSIASIVFIFASLNLPFPIYAESEEVNDEEIINDEISNNEVNNEEITNTEFYDDEINNIKDDDTDKSLRLEFIGKDNTGEELQYDYMEPIEFNINNITDEHFDLHLVVSHDKETIDIEYQEYDGHYRIYNLDPGKYKLNSVYKFYPFNNYDDFYYDMDSEYIINVKEPEFEILLDDDVVDVDTNIKIAVKNVNGNKKIYDSFIEAHNTNSISLIVKDYGAYDADLERNYLPSQNITMDEKGDIIIDFLASPGESKHQSIEGISIHNKEFLFKEFKEITFRDYDFEIILDKKEAEFGEEIEADIIAKDFDCKSPHYIILPIYKDSETYIFNESTIPIIHYDPKKTNKIKLRFSPGNYYIKYYDFDARWKKFDPVVFSVKTPSEIITVNNIFFDKDKASPGENINFRIETGGFLFSDKITKSSVIVTLDKGGDGERIYLENDGKGNLIGNIYIDNYWKNGNYAIKAFLGEYKDEEGVLHYSYYENIFDLNNYFTVTGSPELVHNYTGEEGGGPGDPISPALLTAWSVPKSSQRIGKKYENIFTLGKITPRKNTESNIPASVEQISETGQNESSSYHLSEVPKTGDENIYISLIIFSSLIAGFTVFYIMILGSKPKPTDRKQKSHYQSIK